MRNVRVIKCRRNGFALLVVLLIVATISILSLGFATKADRELSIGENVEVRMQMDYLSRTGLNYGKSLVMNPQNVSTNARGYCEGGSGLQMAGGDDYFDVTVVRAISGTTMRCTYNITSEAYRQVGGSNIATSEVSGVLRFDPCIGYVQMNDGEMPEELIVDGDVWNDGNLHVHGTVNGDVFANGSISEFGTISGEKDTGAESCPVSIPSLSIDDYKTTYNIGAQSYMSVTLSNGTYEDLTLVPSASNPAGIFYRNGDLELKGETVITGMLVVKNNLTIYDKAITITAVKNFPALLVGNDIKADINGANLEVTGFSQMGRHIDVNGRDNCYLVFKGALHVLNGEVKNTGGNGTTVRVIADPMRAALKTWSNGFSPTVTYWMPAGDAYFKSIARN